MRKAGALRFALAALLIVASIPLASTRAAAAPPGASRVLAATACGNPAVPTTTTGGATDVAGTATVAGVAVSSVDGMTVSTRAVIPRVGDVAGGMDVGAC